jgi:hypothetical protein
LSVPAFFYEQNSASWKNCLQPPEKEGFCGEKYSQIRHISREKSRVKSSFLDYRFLQLARFGEVLVLKDSKSTCLMKLTKKKKKTLVGTGSWRARNSSQNLVRRAPRRLCK